MRNILFFLLFAVSFSACKKEPVNGGSTPVVFTVTKYINMGSYNDKGVPDYLVAGDQPSKELISFINTQLPEYSDIRTSHPEYLKNADLSLAVKSEVFITFMDEGTGFTNTLGYYLYKTGSSPKKAEDIQNIVYMFPNSSKATLGGLVAGDKISLGVIEAGTSIGFVLLEKAWNPLTKTVNTKAPHYCSNRELNPENRDELKQHTALFEYPAENKTIIGFEDINRTLPECDHDFNDVVIYATVKPAM